MSEREPPADLDRAHVLMMAALDGEATAEERGELDRLLADHPELQPEWDRLRRVKEVTTAMTVREPPREIWDGYWTSASRRTERTVAWVVVLLGGLVLLAWGSWHWLRAVVADPDLPVLIKAAIVAVVLGAALLLVSVVREKLFVRRRDPYSKEVVR